jgi:hypothetical protein
MRHRLGQLVKPPDAEHADAIRLFGCGAEVADRHPADALNSGIGPSLLNLRPREFAELVRVER